MPFLKHVDRAFVTKDYAGALELAERLRAAGLEAMYLHWVGWVSFERGDPEAALATLSKALRIEPRSVDLRFSHVIAGLSAGRYREVSDEWREVRRAADVLFPERRSVLGIDIWMASAHGRLEEAERLVRDIPSSPKSTAAEWTWLAEVRWRLGDLHGSLEAFNRAEEMGSKSPGYRSLRACVLSDLGRAQEAEALAEESFRDAGSSQNTRIAAYSLAYVRCHDRLEGASASLRRYIEIRPPSFANLDEDLDALLDLPVDDSTTYRQLLEREDPSATVGHVT